MRTVTQIRSHHKKKLQLARRAAAAAAAAAAEQSASGLGAGGGDGIGDPRNQANGTADDTAPCKKSKRGEKGETEGGEDEDEDEEEEDDEAAEGFIPLSGAKPAATTPDRSSRCAEDRM